MLKRLFPFFFLKPVLAVLIIGMALMLGMRGLASMSRESLPDLEIPQALIVTEWAGAAPELVEEEITSPIEEELEGLQGLRRTRSGSIDSLSLISVELEADAPMDASMNRLREAVERARSRLPRKAKPPHIEQVSIRDFPVVTIALHGDTDEESLSRGALWLKKRLERLSSLRKVTLSGQREEVVRVVVCPVKLAARGLSATDLYSAIEASNQDVPGGRVISERRRWSLNLRGAFREVSSVRELPVGMSAEQTPLRLRDVADVRRDFLAPASTAAIAPSADRGFERAVLLSAYKVPGADVSDLVAEIRGELATAQRSSLWPAGGEVSFLWDESEGIEEQLSSVFENSWQSMLAVFLVLLLLLSWREALLVGLAIPLTFLATIGVLALLGSTLNELVLIGLILALGLLVDVFILFMEGIHEAVVVDRLPFADAVRRTIATYALPALSGTLTTLLVFLPMGAISGLEGKFIRVIPMTAVVCLVVAFVFAIFVAVPLSRWVVTTKAKAARSDTVTKQLSSRLRRWLGRAVLRNRRRAKVWVALTAAVFALGMALAALLPEELYPKEDGLRIGVTVELPEDTTLEGAGQVAEQLGEVLLQEPDVDAVARFVGARDPFSTGSLTDQLGINEAPWLIGFSCRLVDKDDRDRLAHQIAESLRERLESSLTAARVPGAHLVLRPETGGATDEPPIQINLFGDDMSQLRDATGDVMRALEGVHGVVDVRDNLGQPSTEVAFHPRRDRLASALVEPTELGAQLRLLTTRERVGRLREPGSVRDVDIVLETRRQDAPADRGLSGMRELGLLSIARRDGPPLPLTALAERRFELADLSIPHLQRRRCVTITAETAEGITPEEAMAQLEDRFSDRRLPWADTVEMEIAGERESSARAYRSMGGAMVIAVLLTYTILAILFGSLRRPIVVMLSVPFALIGVFWGFFVFEIPISFNALVGVIALIGIVVNDAIVMVETMVLHAKKPGVTPEVAAASGAADRLRPIVSTTLTTIAGLLPLGLSDAGWAPLCWAIVFGLLASTVISVIVVPCLFLLTSKTTREEAQDHGE